MAALFALAIGGVAPLGAIVGWSLGWRGQGRVASRAARNSLCLAPFGPPVGVGQAAAHPVEELQVIHHPGEVVPILHLVAGLVVRLGHVGGPRLHAEALGLSDEVHPAVRIERGDAHLGEFEVVGAVVEALFGFRVGV